MTFAEQIEALRSSTVEARGWTRRRSIFRPVREDRPDLGRTVPLVGTLAQAIAHCAQSIECSITAYPKLRSGLFRATIGPIVKRKFLRAHRMSHDVLAPVAGAPEIAATVTLADACDRAIAALGAFDAFTGELAPHLAYGRCSKDDYAELHRLHFDDHMRSFGLA